MNRGPDEIGARLLRERMTTTFAANYLTLLSIIQGTTIAFLFSNVYVLLERGAFGAPQLVLTIGLFFLTILLWHQYQMGVILYEWVPQLFDSAIPFCLGASEFCAILGLLFGSLVTALTLALFFVLGIVGLEYQYYQVAHATTRPGIGWIIRGFRSLDRIVSAVSVLIFAVTAIVLWRNPPSGGQSLWANAAVLVVVLLHAVRQGVEWHLVQQRMKPA